VIRPGLRNALLLAVAAAVLAACAGPPRRAPAPLPGQPRDPATVPDAVPRPEPRARFGNPPFYEVEGRRYFVLATADGYSERGVASWYGPDFHGERTAMGEPYDMYSMTAAHPTLPLPAYARVTNLQNGRSIVVRINDRGPFKKDRILDLSYVAAQKLDVVRTGTAMVEVTALTPGGREPPAAGVASRFYAQAASYAEPANAERMVARLRGQALTTPASSTSRSTAGGSTECAWVRSPRSRRSTTSSPASGRRASRTHGSRPTRAG